MGLLSYRQNFFSTKSSHPVIRDGSTSSSFSDASSQNDLQDDKKESSKSMFAERIASHMLKSQDVVDQRMIKFYNVQNSKKAQAASYFGVMERLKSVISDARKLKRSQTVEMMPS